MGKVYIRIFVYFWVVMMLALVGSSLVVHWFKLGAHKHFVSEHEDPFDGPGGRLLQEIVSDAVNQSLEEVTHGMNKMPPWAINHFYFINEHNEDLLQRKLPKEIQSFAEHITTEQPFFRKRHKDYTIYGRQFQLIDGNPVKLIATPPNDGFFIWKLFFRNIWLFLLCCALISGAACYILSRYIMHDFSVLKEATVRLAEGDLNARVESKLCTGKTEFSRLGSYFNDMADNLQKSILEQKRLIKDVSHELRSPLARLQIALAIAQQKANDEITDELNRIKSAADYLNDVISNILSLPIYEGDNWKLDDTVELTSMIEMVVDQNQQEASSKSVSLDFNTPLDEALIMSNSNTLVGVLDNVLRNAIHYTKPASNIAIQLQQKNNKYYSVTIKDCGPGVSEEDLTGIFEPFFRTCEARARESGGYGLGLAIAQRTVHLHGGTIKASNHPDGGLSIEIELPICELC